MKRFRGMLFDLDGTLLDSAPDLVAALNWLRESEGLAPLETAKMSRHVSRGANGILMAGMPTANDQQFALWKTRFLERYAEIGYRESRLYPGIPQVLEKLKENDMPWGIVTNKLAALTLPILKAAGLYEHIGCVVCGDTLPLSKPDPAPVLHACAQLKIDPEDTLFAGDDVRDVQAGARAGTRTAAVLYGYGSFEFEADHLSDSIVIHRPEEFLQLLA